jgi:hypothetical protein
LARVERSSPAQFRIKAYIVFIFVMIIMARAVTMQVMNDQVLLQLIESATGSRCHVVVTC